ncbi:unnamed protein product [Brassica rapa]|uniref:Uncharacterized protein n=1 Tax=Brassica campestris TaxID=3711 RepID=A0A8D9CRP6_BRACM|nr:unnamed protein product [Brassica rapa]
MVHQLSKLSKRTVHGKDEHADMCGQRVDTCTDRQFTDTTDVLCVLTDTHGRPVCADGHTQTSCPTWAEITRTVHRKGQRAESKDQRVESKDQRAEFKDQRAYMSTDGQPRTSATDVMCVLNRQPMWAKITRTVHGKGQRAESKDQRADMCTDGQPRMSCVC